MFAWPYPHPGHPGLPPPPPAVPPTAQPASQPAVQPPGQFTQEDMDRVWNSAYKAGAKRARKDMKEEAAWSQGGWGSSGAGSWQRDDWRSSSAWEGHAETAPELPPGWTAEQVVDAEAKGKSGEIPWDPNHSALWNLWGQPPPRADPEPSAPRPAAAKANSKSSARSKAKAGVLKRPAASQGS